MWTGGTSHPSLPLPTTPSLLTPSPGVVQVIGLGQDLERQLLLLLTSAIPTANRRAWAGADTSPCHCPCPPAAGPLRCPWCRWGLPAACQCCGGGV